MRFKLKGGPKTDEMLSSTDSNPSDSSTEESERESSEEMEMEVQLYLAVSNRNQRGHSLRLATKSRKIQPRTRLVFLLQFCEADLKKNFHWWSGCFFLIGDTSVVMFASPSRFFEGGV